MSHLQKLRTNSILKWVSLNFAENLTGISKTPFWPSGSVYIAKKTRLYRTKRAAEIADIENHGKILPASCDSDYVGKVSTEARKAAQAALLEYLHCTRNLQFMDAENMSKNSPYFLKRIVKKFENEADIGWSVTRFLRYHPINEFEPFFESLGLQPSEYSPFLPRNLMFLSDDDLLLENYRVLCNYGIARNKIGKIYKEAREVFRYDFGVLPSKLQAYEELGLSQSLIGKVIVCSPYILIGGVNMEFTKVLGVLKSMGLEFSWIEEHIADQNSYNWSRMLDFLSIFSRISCSEEQLSRLIQQHPGLLLDCSGDRALTLIALLLKFGFTVNEIFSIFLQIPQSQVGNFFDNLRQCFLFLFEIEMKVDEIGKIFQSHAVLLGSCTLKKTNSLLQMLNVGKKRLCKHIQLNPDEIKKFVRGSKIERLSRERDESKLLKSKFLLDVGFVKNTNEMEKALKVFRGRGGELQERFDCIVKAGLDRKDVCNMIRMSPQILNQKKDVIERKIQFLVDNLGFPLSSLVSFPSYLNYTERRIKLRLSMYNWLTDQGIAEPMLALSTIIGSAHKIFMCRYVNRHPKGPQVWQDLKKQIYSE